MSIKANQSQMDCKFNNVDMLQEALESQIDIVLRLEEERLKLLKENKEQRFLFKNNELFNYKHLKIIKTNY